MVIDWFRRVESKRGLFAAERISLLYNAVTTVLLLCLFPDLDHPVQMLADRVGIAVVTFALMFWYHYYPCRLTAGIRIMFQISLLAYWYPNTFEFNRLFPNLDCYFATAEQYLFGCQPAVEFSKAWPSMWVSEPLNLGYISYFPLIFLVVMACFLFRFHQFEQMSFIIIASFFLYYLIYLFVPVAGPQFYYPAVGLDNILTGNFIPLGDYFHHNSVLIPGPGYDHGFFYNLVEVSHEVGERPTAAFPSSHVGITTILLFLAWRINHKLCWCMIPFYVLMCFATVYIQAHYLIDVIGGWISSVIIYRVTIRLYHWRFASLSFKDLLK